MYYFLFIMYIVFATTFAVVLFIWALRSGQFKDQQRARFLPLVKEYPRNGAAQLGRSRRWRMMYSLLGLFTAFLLAAGIVLVYATFHKS